MKRLLFLALIALLCLGVGLTLAYSSSASETWKDPTSGLTWQVSPTGDLMKWQEARSHCQNLSLGGYSDWCLPTISELRSLIRGCPATQKGGACGVTDSCLSREGCRSSACDGCSIRGGPGLVGSYLHPEISGSGLWYWSSSPVADNANYAWVVDFYDGSVDYYRIADYHKLARCVRP